MRRTMTGPEAAEIHGLRKHTGYQATEGRNGGEWLAGWLVGYLVSTGDKGQVTVQGHWGQ